MARFGTLPLGIVANLSFLVLPAIGRAEARTARIRVEQDVGAPARHALTHLEKALAKKGLKVSVSEGETAAERGPAGGIIEIRAVRRSGIAKWTKPESYRIACRDKAPRKHVVVTGSDAVGLMYGVFELAEQVAMASGTGHTVWTDLHEAAGAPAVEIRADNPFLTVEKDNTISPWFYEETFWKRYFDTLARSRFNLCDIHAMYRFEDTHFPNLFPYFVKNPDRPEASWPFEDQERNLAMLNRIIDLAEERGVHVALMNYTMDFPNVDPGDEKTIIAHTRWAVAELLRRCPKLWMFGFRIGESGRSEAFFERSFLGGITDSGKERVRLYTRTWGAELRDLAKIGMKYPENFYIEIKYNGEHLGAPYHAIQGRWGSYAYEGYLNYPRYWKVVWQIRANGTHRLFPWFDADFARRCVQSASFGGAVGFTLEPITTYYTQDPARIFKDPRQADFLAYAFERYWAWYLVWGRLAYNPDTPDRVFAHAFRERFGAKAGNRARSLLTLASRIVPLIYRHHCLGPDHRNMAPEFETGNNSNYNTKKSLVKDIDVFAQSGVLDQQSYLSPSGYADAYLAGRTDGKITPIEAARRLDDLARQCLDLLNTIRVSTAKKEWALLATDVRALCNLARYYAEKDRAACALQFYRKTGDASRVIAAGRHAAKARAYWKDLANVAERQYAPLLDRLRMGWDFTWSKLILDTDADVRRVAEVEKEIEKSEGLHVGHVPVRRASPGKDLRLQVGVYGNSRPEVSLRYSLGDRPYRTLKCTRADRWTYASVLPGAELHGGDRLRYWFAASANGVTVTAPKAGEADPYALVVSDDDEGPAVAWREVTIDRPANRVRVECTIDDPSGITEARLEWKPMPSDQPWAEPVVMTRRAGTAVFTGHVPLTHEGILYSVVALDGRGNATRYPGARLETPYAAINPWDPGLPAEMRIESVGKLARGTNARAVPWKTVTGTGRPGRFYEYHGENGRVTFPFSVKNYSDYRLTIARVVNRNYGTADMLIDDRKVGVLQCRQEGTGGYLPAQDDALVRGLEAGQHRLAIVLTGGGGIGVEGFRFTPIPARVDRFAISQSFPGFVGPAGEKMYPAGRSDIVWKPAEVDERGVVHLDAQLHPNQDCHAFAATVLVCEEPLNTHLLIGSNDGDVVWLNGKIVNSNPRKRYFKYNENRIPVTLNKGENLLVLLVMQAGRTWMFNVNVESYGFTSRRPDPIAWNKTSSEEK